MLKFVEMIYRLYPKPAIANSLWSAKLPAGVSWEQMSRWEDGLAVLRPSAEFIVSLIIAQKGEV